MFADLLKGLLAPDPAPLGEPDARLALAALLVRVARADGTYAAEEVARIDGILASRYQLSPFEVSKLRREAEVLEAEAPDTVRFTRALKQAVPYEDRLAVIEALWQIVLADGTRDEEEDSLLRQIAPLLGVNDRDSNMARLKVQGNS